MSQPSLILYDYWRSSAAYRVRIALNLKGVAYRQIAVDLRVGAHRQPAFMARNPQGLAPALEVDGVVLTQSGAIIEWLEERFPEPSLLPRAANDRAVVRAMAAIIGADIHPINNLRIQTYLRAELAASDDQVAAWIARWMHEGFEALDALVARYGGAFAFGDQPSLADCFLVPQAYSAARFGVDMSAYPALNRVVSSALTLDAVKAAHPDRQPDAPAA